MVSAKLDSLHISRQIALELLNAGIATSVYENYIRDNTKDNKHWAYKWHLDTDRVVVYYNTGAIIEDNLACKLILMPTSEARIYYLNNQ